MSQNIDLSLWKEFQEEQKKEKSKLESKAMTINSNKKSSGQWVSKIVEKINISDVAAEYGVESCPKCESDIYFDDSRGWFICKYAKWTRKEKCDFAGNIVSFMKFCLEGKW